MAENTGNTTTTVHVNIHYIDLAATHMPCSAQSHFHKLKCSHTVHTGPAAICGTNCETPTPNTSPPFICYKCLVTAHNNDLDLTESNCPSDVDSLLSSLDQEQRAEVTKRADELQARGARRAELAKGLDWVRDFFGEYPGAFEERKREGGVVNDEREEVRVRVHEEAEAFEEGLFMKERERK